MYKLDLSAKCKIHNVFHMSLLEQNITRKGRINELFSELEPKFNASNNKKYKIDAIKDSGINAKKADRH